MRPQKLTCIFRESKKFQEKPNEEDRIWLVIYDSWDLELKR
jgi:hypothetical protein